jgi:hypothetical protein
VARSTGDVDADLRAFIQRHDEWVIEGCYEALVEAAACATRVAASLLDGTERRLLHGRCMPTAAGELDGMDAQAAQWKLAGFKTYTQFGPRFLVHHSGFDTGVKEGPYDPAARGGVDVLIGSVREHGVKNVYAELGSTWRFVMRDPDQAAHLPGKLLVAFDEDNTLWGTDSIWYGSPQDRILDFRAFEFGREFQDRYGYPALTPAIKRESFGLNGARVYGLKADEMRGKPVRDKVRKTRLDDLNDPDPAFASHGPRTRRELLAYWALHGETPQPTASVETKTAPQRLQVQFRLLALAGDLLRRARGDALGDQLQRLAGALRQHLVHAGALEVEKVIEGPGDAWAAHDDAVVGEKQHRVAGEPLRDPLGLAVVEHEAVVFVLVGHRAMEAQRVLARHLQPSALQQGERGGERHVGVQHAGGLGHRAMDPAVDEKGRRLDLVPALDLVALRVDHHQVVGTDLAPQQSLRVDQEVSRPPRHRAREVVADALAESQLVRGLQRAGEILAGFGDSGRVHAAIILDAPRRLPARNDGLRPKLRAGPPALQPLPMNRASAAGRAPYPLAAMPVGRNRSAPRASNRHRRDPLPTPTRFDAASGDELPPCNR